MFLTKGGPKSRFSCLLAAPKGVARIQAAHPDVPIITAISDACLNKNCYLFLGLNDFGDGIFGAKRQCH
jgi:uracil phosphoribosyltransferase